MLESWSHTIVQISSVILSLGILIWKNRRDAKKELQQKHEENQHILSSLNDRVKWFDDWRKAHESASRQRDKLIRDMELAMSKISMMAEVTERRLQILERQLP